MAIAEGARLAGYIDSDKFSVIVNNESAADRFQVPSSSSSSSSSDEDSGPPPLPPPRSESLIAKEVPVRQNGVSVNPEFEIPDRLSEAVNGDHEPDDSNDKTDVSVDNRGARCCWCTK